MSMGSPICEFEIRCKCCGAAARRYGVVDFHKHCETQRGGMLELSGIPIYYHRCVACGFIFTSAFDGFSNADFTRVIYNADYAALDPDYAETRPLGNARLVTQLLAAQREVRLLDYGGGNGRTAELLRQAGFGRVASYDPFVPAHADRPAGRFACIICFEVMEHSPQPIQTLQDLDSLLEDDGLILFSTLLQPPNIHELGVNWWYLAPRNGHISLYSKEALATLWRQRGFKFGSFNEGLHVACRQVPTFAKHFLRGPL
ncbi:MAG: class I SAM-dependent methyltransferase [Phycisphaerae bacterium]